MNEKSQTVGVTPPMGPTRHAGGAIPTSHVTKRGKHDTLFSGYHNFKNFRVFLISNVMIYKIKHVSKHICTKNGHFIVFPINNIYIRI